MERRLRCALLSCPERLRGETSRSPAFPPSVRIKWFFNNLLDGEPKAPSFAKIAWTIRGVMVMLGSRLWWPGSRALVDKGNASARRRIRENRRVQDAMQLQGREKIVIICLVLLASLTGCAGKSLPPVVVSMAGGKNVVAVEASNFKFEPHDIEVKGKGALILQVKNISGNEHNLTLENPQGHLIESTNLPPHGTVTIKVDLPKTGTYRFYCNKPFHAALGMKGRIVVTGEAG
jgi:uncharacterized cupredoxin-like copper-binding protein